MPFNIELAKPSSGISIKVQAVKNTINVYFAGPQATAGTVRDNWIVFVRANTGCIEREIN